MCLGRSKRHLSPAFSVFSSSAWEELGGWEGRRQTAPGGPAPLESAPQFAPRRGFFEYAGSNKIPHLTRYSAMTYSLADGSAAHLVAIVQNRNYQIGYQEVPADAEEEILRIARAHLAKEWWRPAPMMVVGQEREALNALLRGRNLPAVLCIGLFYSIRGGTGRDGHASHLYVVWLQEELLPYLSEGNQAAFARINWPRAR